MTTTTHHHQPRSDDELIDARQVALEELHGRVKARTVESWRSQSRAQPLAFVVVGRRRLYRRGDVRAYLAARRHDPAA